MAESWPNEALIEEKEILGRRIFDSQSDFSPSMIEPDIFDDTRIGTGLSFDRLGKGSVNQAVVRELTKLGDVEAGKRNKVFHGWAAQEARYFKKVKFVPDQVTGETGETPNPYHALLLREDVRNKVDTFRLSRSLWVDFYRSGGCHVPPDRQAQIGHQRR
jgi:hypothetical protein